MVWREDLTLRRHLRPGPFVLLAITLPLMALGIHASVIGCRLVVRNFYGQLRLRDEDGERKLFHGVITHGRELRDPGERRQPTAYYCPGTGIDLAWRAARGMRSGSTGLRIGVAGLGAGTLAAYGTAGDTIRFYELNPKVLDVARSEFHFLSDTPAALEMALGDARLALENEPAQQFDLLAIDVFSGDAVPVHLLTREAFTAYFRHLKPGGILAFHITNIFLNLEPVVASAAAALGKQALVLDYAPSAADVHCFGAQWALVVDSNTGQFPAARMAQIPAGFRTWTDDYSSIFPILRR
jgi:SAM-dependent methyltransferase